MEGCASFDQHGEWIRSLRTSYSALQESARDAHLQPDWGLTPGIISHDIVSPEESTESFDRELELNDFDAPVYRCLRLDEEHEVGHDCSDGLDMELDQGGD